MPPALTLKRCEMPCRWSARTSSVAPSIGAILAPSVPRPNSAGEGVLIGREPRSRRLHLFDRPSGVAGVDLDPPHGGPDHLDLEALLDRLEDGVQHAIVGRQAPDDELLD